MLRKRALSPRAGMVDVSLLHADMSYHHRRFFVTEALNLREIELEARIAQHGRRIISGVVGAPVRNHVGLLYKDLPLVAVRLVMGFDRVVLTRVYIIIPDH
jgi:hypothetical protein